MKLNPQLKQITSLTLDQYNDGAEDFWEGTSGHDVSQNIAALLRYIEGDPQRHPNRSRGGRAQQKP